MEIRKVQKTGVSTLTVSLPKGWAEAQGLKPGDPVEMIVLKDGSLSLRSAASRREAPETRQVWVKSGESPAHLTRKLIAAYLSGHNIIEVRSKERLDFEMKREIKEFSRLTIGPEVIEETANTVVLHDLSDPSELPQRKCIRRMHLLVSSMHADAITSFEAGDEALAKDVIERDFDVDRLYLMVVKQFNLLIRDRSISDRIGSDIEEGMHLMLAARPLERIGDHAEKIARNAMLRGGGEADPSVVRRMRELSQRALSVLEEAVKAMFRRDVEEANRAIDDGNAVVRDCEDLRGSMELSGREGVIEDAILDSIIRTSMYAVDIGETAINMAMTGDSD